VDATSARKCLGWGVGKSLTGRDPQTGLPLRDFFLIREDFWPFWHLRQRASNNLDVTSLGRLQKHNELNKLSIFVRIDKLVARMLVMIRLVFEVLFFRPAHLVRRGVPLV
jgi:hypothetical protein